jgi:hypothetical protein
MCYFCHLVVISSKYIYLIEAMFKVSDGIFPFTYIWYQMYCSEKENVYKIFSLDSLSNVFKQGPNRTMFVRI